jgi:hypothetical protein
VDVSHVELPDGRVLAFGAVPVLGFNLVEAERFARRGARTRQLAVADMYPRDDGTWGVSDPVKELDLFSNLAAGVLFSHAAVEGLGRGAIREIDHGGASWRRLARVSELRDRLVRPRSGASSVEVFGRLIRGDADGCAEDALELVRSLRPELLPQGE